MGPADPCTPTAAGPDSAGLTSAELLGDLMIRRVIPPLLAIVLAFPLMGLVPEDHGIDFLQDKRPDVARDIRAYCRSHYRGGQRLHCGQELARRADVARRDVGADSPTVIGARRVAGAVTEAVVNKLDPVAARELIRSVSRDFSSDLRDVLAEELRGPNAALASELASSTIETAVVDSAMRLLQEDVVDDASWAAMRLTGSMTSAILDQVKADTPQLLEPLQSAVGDTLRSEVFPALSRAMNEAMAAPVFQKNLESSAASVTTGTLSVLANSIASEDGVGAAVEFRTLSILDQVIDRIGTLGGRIEDSYEEKKADVQARLDDAARRVKRATVQAIGALILAGLIFAGAMFFRWAATQNRDGIALVTEAIKRRYDEASRADDAPAKDALLDVVLDIREMELMRTTGGGKALSRVVDANGGALKIEKSALRERAEQANRAWREAPSA